MRAETTMQQTAQDAQAAARLRQAVDQARQDRQQAQREAQQVNRDVQQAVRDAQQAARDAQQQSGGLGMPPAPERIEVRDGHVIVRDANGNVLQNIQTGTSVPSFPMDMPPRVANVAYMFFVTIAVMAIGIPLVRAFGRWLDRRSAAPAALPADLAVRLDRIEGALETVAVEVERISEGQRFTSRLMAEMRQLPQLDGVRAEGTRAEGVRAEGVRIPEPRR